jgi:hypothetical protein
MFFPAADTIAFSEGGVESMRLNSSGVLVTTNDASISGLTVGKGGGAVSSNTAVGSRALEANTTGLRNTAVGNGAGLVTTTGNYNAFIGSLSGTTNTTGSFNTAVGDVSLQSNTTGTGNTVVGFEALSRNTTAANNTAVGTQSLLFNTGAQNTAVGHTALFNNTTASNNTAVGYQAGFSNTTGLQHTFIGERSGQNNTTGNGNTFVGRFAGFSNTTGSNNTFIGYRNTDEYGAGHLVTTGSKNTILGSYNGNQGGLDIRTASNYIVLSDGDGNPLISTSQGRSVALEGAVPQTGEGITFPATQVASSNANTLDDYEEGTWTPTILWGGSDTGAVYTFQVGTYTKIGNQVSFFGYAQITTQSSATGNFTVGGLPFTSRNVSNSNQLCNAAIDNASSDVTQPRGRVDTNSTVINILSGSGTNNWGILTSSIRAAAFRVYVSGTYFV